jgi:outer membrane receptor protein involved in Fe transport
VAASVSILTRSRSSASRRRTSRAAQFLPGFHAYFRESFGGPPPIITSRGFFGGGEAEYVQLRIDGVPVQDVESGIVDWRRIRAANIERIEALRGPASSLYGDTAIAGVIQVCTKNAPAGGNTASVSASGGSYGTAATDLSYGFAREASRARQRDVFPDGRVPRAQRGRTRHPGTSRRRGLLPAESGVDATGAAISARIREP